MIGGGRERVGIVSLSASRFRSRSELGEPIGCDMVLNGSFGLGRGGSCKRRLAQGM